MNRRGFFRSVVGAATSLPIAGPGVMSVGAQAIATSHPTPDVKSANIFAWYSVMLKYGVMTIDEARRLLDKDLESLA